VPEPTGVRHAANGGVLGDATVRPEEGRREAPLFVEAAFAEPTASRRRQGAATAEVPRSGSRQVAAIRVSTELSFRLARWGGEKQAKTPRMMESTDDRRVDGHRLAAEREQVAAADANLSALGCAWRLTADVAGVL
jgi:hypothetical protein